MARTRDWYKLDNAAKIMPGTVKGADTRVFRVVCELKEEVDPEVLQRALDETLMEYPHFRCCLRGGFFWYYLDRLRDKPLVTEDHEHALKALWIPGRRNHLFRVTYYRRRINVEVFHVLADGTGAFTFLQTLVRNYLIGKHHLNREDFEEDAASVGEKTDDAFTHFYQNKKEGKKSASKMLKSLFPQNAYHLKGIKDPDLYEHVLEGTVSTQKMLDLAHSMHTTIGVLSTSLFIEAIIREMAVSERKRPVVVSVPVNLRQFFPSKTTRNFFGVINVSYNAEKYDGTLESVIPEVDREFKEMLQPEQVFRTMNSYAALEHNWAVKMVPLWIKNLAVQSANNIMDRGNTTTVSNVGQVKMCDELAQYIDRFAVFCSCVTSQMCICTFRDKMVFGITTCFTAHTMPLNFFRRLTDLGLEVELVTNDYSAEPAKAAPKKRSGRAARKSAEKDAVQEGAAVKGGAQESAAQEDAAMKDAAAKDTAQENTAPSGAEGSERGDE